ncbi:sporulation histidine kinase inhibitor Sda [Salinibacillus kushneri]|uniref:sporulation histidine kinase inhibitor Sda n=1 Tax=Salinibacillus kushneri TaxID=237682 RepID=UPI001FE1FBA1|nr:sporulation histidine kinase inhibitor Sda [Salinibacillus kushneri]
MIFIRYSYLTDEKLVDAYQKALQLQLENEFIKILEEEIQVRNLPESKVFPHI